MIHFLAMPNAGATVATALLVLCSQGLPLHEDDPRLAPSPGGSRAKQHLAMEARGEQRISLAILPDALLEVSARDQKSLKAEAPLMRRAAAQHGAFDSNVPLPSFHARAQAPFMLTQEASDIWIVSGYSFPSRGCREEQREGWSGEERRECFNEDMTCRSTTHQRVGNDCRAKKTCSSCYSGEKYVAKTERRRRITCASATAACTTSECCDSKAFCGGCDDGYVEKSNRRRRVMCATAKCNANTECCDVAPCPAPTGVVHAGPTTQCANTAVGGKCVATCAAGYVASLASLTCQQGPKWNPATWTCTAAPCKIVNATGSGLDAACKTGFTGKITWDGATPSGECAPSVCAIENSNLKAGFACACNDGFDGKIQWTGSTPQGICKPADCAIKHSNEKAGKDCACLDSFAGNITWTGNTASGECEHAACEVEFSNKKPGKECACKAGFKGNISWVGAETEGECTKVDVRVAFESDEQKEEKLRELLKGKYNEDATEIDTDKDGKICALELWAAVDALGIEKQTAKDLCDWFNQAHNPADECVEVEKFNAWMTSTETSPPVKSGTITSSGRFLSLLLLAGAVVFRLQGAPLTP